MSLLLIEALTISAQPSYRHHYLEGEVATMAEEEKKGRAEETAEKTGEMVGKGLKKGFGIAKSLGKGTKDAVKGKKEE